MDRCKIPVSKSFLSDVQFKLFVCFEFQRFLLLYIKYINHFTINRVLIKCKKLISFCRKFWESPHADFKISLSFSWHLWNCIYSIHAKFILIHRFKQSMMTFTKFTLKPKKNSSRWVDLFIVSIFLTFHLKYIITKVCKTGNNYNLWN